MDLVLGILMKVVVPGCPNDVVRTMIVSPRTNVVVAHLLFPDGVIEISLPSKTAISVEHWITSCGIMVLPVI